MSVGKPMTKLVHLERQGRKFTVLTVHPHDGNKTEVDANALVFRSKLERKDLQDAEIVVLYLSADNKPYYYGNKEAISLISGEDPWKWNWQLYTP